jgi:hypothetical protein
MKVLKVLACWLLFFVLSLSFCQAVASQIIYGPQSFESGKDGWQLSGCSGRVYKSVGGGMVTTYPCTHYSETCWGNNLEDVPCYDDNQCCLAGQKVYDQDYQIRLRVGDNNEEGFMWKEISTVGYENIKLSFHASIHNLEEDKECLKMYYSTNGGTTWTTDNFNKCGNSAETSGTDFSHQFLNSATWDNPNFAVKISFSGMPWYGDSAFVDYIMLQGTRFAASREHRVLQMKTVVLKVVTSTVATKIVLLTGVTKAEKFSWTIFVT